MIEEKKKKNKITNDHKNDRTDYSILEFGANDEKFSFYAVFTVDLE